MTRGFEPTIGLEIHAELNTATKMFCGCANPMAQPGGGLELKPNSLVCPVCLGLPGALPFANEQAIVKTYLIARSLGCQLADHTHWERKNYFYPDLPKGFQISQYAAPIGVSGKLADVMIRRVHLEEDTGKLLHPEGADYSLVDFNRSGVPLVELVTEPQIASAKQAVLLAKEYQLVLRYLGVSDADMEKGQFRVEANISIAQSSKLKAQEQGTKVEVKNLNSFRAVERAIEYEIKRQSELIQSGKPVVQETRGWDEAKQQTVSQRVKETESDYRYFPEPDLPPISPSSKFKVPTLRSGPRPKGVGAQSSKVPELPEAKRQKMKKWGVTPQYVEVLVADPNLVARFEELAKRLPERINAIASLLVNRPQTRTMNDKELIKLAALPDHRLKFVLKGGAIKEKTEVSSGELEQAIAQTIRDQKAAVTDYKAGKTAVLGFLIGRVVRQLPGVDPKRVAEQLKQSLG